MSLWRSFKPTLLFIRSRNVQLPSVRVRPHVVGQRLRLLPGQQHVSGQQQADL